MSKTYTIKQVQILSMPIDEAWHFFSNPKNLAIITPASLDFKITSELKTDTIFEGQIISYRVKPLLGIPLKWISQITKVETKKMFIDEQLKGPYKMWHHEHYFKEVDGGTEMTDVVDYKLPFGFLGSIGVPIVKNQLENIFMYRRKKMEELFGEKRRPV